MLLTLVTQIDWVIYQLTKVKGTIFLILEGVKLLWSMEDEVEDFTQDA